MGDRLRSSVHDCSRTAHRCREGSVTGTRVSDGYTLRARALHTARCAPPPAAPPNLTMALSYADAKIATQPKPDNGVTLRRIASAQPEVSRGRA